MSVSITPSTLNPWSCVTCRRRKVRCDRRTPCSNCATANVDCHYPVSYRAPRREHQTVLKRAEGKPRQSELLERISRLEGILETLNIQVPLESSAKDGGPSCDDIKKPASDVARISGGTNKYDMEATKASAWDARYDYWKVHPAGVLKELESLDIDPKGGGYVSSRFWSEFQDEMRYIRATFEYGEDESDSEEKSLPTSSTPLSRPFSGVQSFLWGHPIDGRDLRDLRPLPSQVPFIWQTYLDLVDPFIKILHIPTISRSIREVNSSSNPSSPAMEALMFSIYLAAVTALSDEEVMLNFNTSKDSLKAQYRYGTEQALARADFINTTDISVIQAFTIFLTVVPSEEATRSLWSLAGLLIRLAMSLGLHRDGSYFVGMPPFEVEMRRRLWWHICYTDARYGEDQVAEASITERMFDTLLPTNINDADIELGMPNPPVARDGPTDLTVCLIQRELWQISRRVQLSMSTLANCPYQKLDMGQNLELLSQTRKNLEQKYLKQLNPEIPLHLFLEKFTRLILAKVELVMYHKFLFPGAADPPSPVERDRLFKLSLEIIDLSRALEHGQSTKKWSWLFHGYSQWHTIGVILSQLCRRPWGPISERAWASLKKLFDELPRASKKEPLWLPLCDLMNKVQNHRETEQRRLQGSSYLSREFRPQRENYLGVFDNERSSWVKRDDRSRSAAIDPSPNGINVPPLAAATMASPTSQETVERLSGDVHFGNRLEASPVSTHVNTQFNVQTAVPFQATLLSSRQDFIFPGGMATGEPNFEGGAENSNLSWPLTEPWTEHSWSGDGNFNGVNISDEINWQAWNEMIERMGADMGFSSGSGI